MNVKETFLNLTKYTFPYGYEFFLEGFLPKGYQKDEYGNYFLKIGDSKTMFTCHLDTACSRMTRVNHTFDGNFVRTDGRSILGADDKAGMTIVLSLIENKVPGLYYFFIGEEVGCIGSNAAAKLDFSNYERCVSFDRRGYNSIITHQFYGRCCSDEFAEALSDQLNEMGLHFSPDNTGIMTDSASFMGEIHECTNISVGYFDEHTRSESQDISFLDKLCKSMHKIDWENLPVARDCKDIYDFNEEEEYEGEMESAILQVTMNGEKYRVRIKQSRLVEERSYIYDWVFKQGSYHEFSGVDWDGYDCYIRYAGSRELLGTRNELSQVIDELGNIPSDAVVILSQVSNNIVSKHY